MSGEPLYSGLAKVSRLAASDRYEEPNRLAARRELLQVWPDRIVCGDAMIPCSEIRKGSLGFKSEPRAYLVRLETHESIYYFEVHPNPFWLGRVPFPLDRPRRRPFYRRLPLFVQIVVVLVVLYYFWRIATT